jgi:hypothetical protein
MKDEKLVDYTATAGGPLDIEQKETGFFEKLGLTVAVTVIFFPIVCWIGEFWVKFVIRLYTALSPN